jgi:hypothetical protein
MAPLSIVPGRVRYEISSLVGKKNLCGAFEEAVTATPGVIAVSASHHTGRLLIKYDASMLSPIDLAALLTSLLARLEEEGARPAGIPLGRKTSGGAKSSRRTGHLFLDVVAHALLPRPFDFLVPTAMTIFTR